MGLSESCDSNWFQTIPLSLISINFARFPEIALFCGLLPLGTFFFLSFFHSITMIMGTLQIKNIGNNPNAHSFILSALPAVRTFYKKSCINALVKVNSLHLLD